MSTTLLVILLGLACGSYAQLLVPLHGSCTSSVQCIGVAICVQGVCQCPPVYAAIGITCIYSGGDELPPPLVGAAPVAPLLAGPGPVPVPAAYAYPGASCNTAKTCVGGSFCYQGSCGCPSGYIVSGYSCVQHQVIDGPPPPLAVPAHPPKPFMPVPNSHPVPFGHGPAFGHGPEPFFGPANPTFFGQVSEQFIGNEQGPDFAPHPFQAHLPGPILPGPPPPPGPIPCPPQQVLIGSACLPQAMVAKLPAGILCTNGGGCTGGSICMNSVCTCPANQVWGNTGCILASKIRGDAVPVPAFPLPPQPVYPMPAHPPHPGHNFAPFLPDAAASLVALGSSCSAHQQCVAGAFCQLGVCACRPSYVPYGSVCLLRRQKAKEETIEQQQESKKKKKN